MKVNNIALALGLTSMVGLVGCEDSSSTPSVNTPTQSLYQVKAIDGYLQNAQVWLDLNGNFEFDENEPKATSGEGGVANLDITQIREQGLSPESYQIIVQAIAGETIDEDKPDSPIETGFTMSAPAGEVNVTPLSTLVNIKLSEVLTQDMSAEKVEQMKQEVVTEVASELGIDKEAILSDYAAGKTADDSATSNAAQQAAYAARSIVESGQVLPETPQKMSEVVEEVKQTEAETSFEKVTSVINNEIKKEVEDTSDPQILESAEPAIDKDMDMVTDSDEDGVPDELDPFPQDSSEWMDNDGDDLGDHADTDDDNDGFTDDVDVYPLNAQKAGDHDGDGIDSVADEYPYDFDNDGHPDAEDAFPKDKLEWLDSDQDKIGDNEDTDDDNDGFLDDSDSYPLDEQRAGDHDGDGIDSVIDEYPYDFDNDGHPDAEDAFPNNNSEWADNDQDEIGDNEDTDDDNDGFLDDSDSYPLDGQRAGDHDGDGTDSVSDEYPYDFDNDGSPDSDDAYPEDNEKSVADSVTVLDTTKAELFAVCNEPFELKVSITQTVEQLNNGDTRTTLNKRYLTPDDNEFGEEESVDIQTDNSFSRITHFVYDFNQDGNSTFEGRILDVGERNNSSETFYSYIDESDAGLEGCSNGGGREFDDLAFSDRDHPTDLSGIDTIQQTSRTFEVQANQSLMTTSQVTQYDVEGFVLGQPETHIPNYARTDEVLSDGLMAVRSYTEEDWDADGSISRIKLLDIHDTGYKYDIAGPIWANPTDGQMHEYADYNFTPDNWDNLTNYWNETSVRVNQDGSSESYGKRYVLDEINNIKLSEDLLFNEWQSITRDVSETERVEEVKWKHNNLVDYDFTVPNEDIGQAYRIQQKLDNDIWVTYSFDEWGSQFVENLASQVETARSGGATIADIDDTVIEGLSRYAALLPSNSFQYTEQGEARDWYVVSQNPAITDGTPSLVELQLVDHGINPDWYVGDVGVDTIILIPRDPNNIGDWWDSFYRTSLQTYAMDIESSNFSWSNDLGMFFLTPDAAQAVLDEVLNPEYRVCYSQDQESSGDDLFQYSDFHHAANICGYIGIDSSYLDDVTLYLSEWEPEGENQLAVTFDPNGTGTKKASLDGYDATFNWQINSDGVVELDWQDGNKTYFAYIASNDENYSFLGFHSWEEGDVSYRSIEGNEFSTIRPYSVCYTNDTEWDDETDLPVENATFEQFQQAIDECGGQTGFTQEMVKDLVLYDYNQGKDRLRVYEFHADGTLTRTEGDKVKTWSWSIDENGYIHVVIADNDFMYISLLNMDEDKYALKVFSQWPEGGNNVSEVYGTEYSSTNPKDFAAVSAVLLNETFWYSLDKEWVYDEQADRNKERLFVIELLSDTDGLDYSSTGMVEQDNTVTELTIENEDIILSSNGWTWTRPDYRADLTGGEIVLFADDSPNLTYTAKTASVQDLENQTLALKDWPYFYDPQATYPNGSTIVQFKLSNDQTQYWLSDEATFGDDLLALFTAYPALDSVAFSKLHAHEIGSLAVELVRENNEDTGTANFFWLDHENQMAQKVGDSSWQREVNSGQEMIIFQVPEHLLYNEENWFFTDLINQVFSVFPEADGGDGLVHLGDVTPAGEDEFTQYLFNITAKDTLLDEVDTPE